MVSPACITPKGTGGSPDGAQAHRSGPSPTTESASGESCAVQPDPPKWPGPPKWRGATEVFLECSNQYGLTAHLRGPRGAPALLPPCWPPTPDQPVQGFLFLLLSPSEEVAHCTTSWWWDRETEINHHKAVARGQPHPASGPFLPRHAALKARPLEQSGPHTGTLTHRVNTTGYPW